MKRIIFLIPTCSLLFSIAINAQNNAWTSARPDGHAPISIMQDHYHKKGQVMFSYRYMPMWMNGNLSGSEKTDDNTIFQNYMVAPQKMVMQMHMLGMMYAPSDHITLMAMTNYTSKKMDLIMKNGTEFTTKSQGFGDIALTGLLKIINKNRQSLHGIVGVSIPTGSIDQRDNTPMAQNAKLAYPMQLGSGTWDPFLGATYLGQKSHISWGIQGRYKFRSGTNKQDYRLGNEINMNGWFAVKASDYFSFSGSFQYFKSDKISGADPDLTPMMMPLFNTANSGKDQMQLGIGSNFLVPKGPLKEVRIATEYVFPIYQHVNGIQMKNNGSLTIGLQYSIE